MIDSNPHKYPLTFLVPDSMYAIIATLAMKEGRSLGDQVAYMLRDYLACYGIRPMEVL